MNYVYPGFDKLSLCQQMQVQVFGKEIWKYGFRDLLYRVTGSRFIAFTQSTAAHILRGA